MGLNGNWAEYLIKGSNTYDTPSRGNPIVVFAQGPDGTSISSQTCTGIVAPMPSGIPGTQPNPTYHSSRPEDVDFQLGAETPISTAVGVGFQNQPVAVMLVQVNGQPDKTTSHYTAQINWGDGDSWDKGTVVYKALNGNWAEYEIEGSHTYQETSSGYPIVVFLNGPDGTSTSGRTCTAIVGPNPYGLDMGDLSQTQWDDKESGYDGTIPISGGSGGYTGTVTGLPTGLTGSVSQDEVVITGTPQESGTFNLGVSIEDSTGGTFNKTFSLAINAPVTLGDLIPTVWKQGQPGYDGTIEVTGGTGSYSNARVTGLPAGLTYSLTGGTIAITGTPTRSGTFSLGVSVQDSDGEQATGTDDLTITPAGDLMLGPLSPTTWKLNQPGYDGTIHVSGGSGIYSNAGIVGLPAGLKYALSGNTISITGTPTQAGTFHLGVSVHDSSGDLASATDTLTIQAPALVLGPLSPTQWTLNQPGYDGTIHVSGGSGSCSNAAVTGLPAGLKYSLSGNTISITGTPTQSGTFTLGVSVHDSIGDQASGTDSLTINVPPLALGPLTPTQWGLDQPNYDGTIHISGGTGHYTVALVTGLPKGLSFSLSGNTVSITGTPQQAGIFTLNVWVQDSSGSQAQAAYQGAAAAAPQQANNGNTVHGTDKLTITSADLTTSVHDVLPVKGVNLPTAGKALDLSFLFGNETVEVPVTITNVGNGPANGTATVQLSLSTTRTFNPSLTLGSQTVTLHNLAANGSTEVTLGTDPKHPLAIPTTLTTGTKYYLVAKVSSSTISDSNPNNNAAATSSTFEYVGKPSSPPPTAKGAAAWFWTGQNVPSGYKDFYHFLSDTLNTPTPTVPLSRVPVVLKNNATTADNGPWSATVKLTLSPPANSHAQPQSWTKTVTGTNVAAGAEQVVTFTPTMPANLTGYSLSATVTAVSGRGINASQFTANAVPATNFVANNEGLRTYSYVPGGGDSNPTVGYGINLNAVTQYADVENALAADVRAYYQANYPKQYNDTTFYNQNLATSQEVINLLKSQAKTNTPTSHTQVITDADAWNLLALALPHYQSNVQTRVTQDGGNWSNLSLPQQVALDDLAYNYGVFPKMTQDLVNGDYPGVAFNLCDAARTTQAKGLNTRTEAELQLLVYGHTTSLGQVVTPPGTQAPTQAGGTTPAAAPGGAANGSARPANSTAAGLDVSSIPNVAVSPVLAAAPNANPAPAGQLGQTPRFDAVFLSAPSSVPSYYLVGKPSSATVGDGNVQDLLQES